MPRRPQSPDAAAGAAAKGKGDKGRGKDKDGGKDGAENLQPPTDADDRLVFDAYVAGLSAIDRIVRLTPPLHTTLQIIRIIQFC